ncbi:MAG: hypothetical protein QOD99_2840 [Chthoniobacter sp.]|nr:hypothetical protein [Chthoniobacter sp.]
MNPRAFAVVFGVLLAFAVRAEISAPLPMPPQARPLNVTVHRGERVQISLRAYGKANQQWTFKVRAQPSFGRLSAPVNAGLESATVTYEHGGVGEPDRDRFTYVVQSSAGVSAPAEVEIKVVDEPPILVVVDEIDFGNVTPGLSATNELSVQNRGGGIVTGVLLPPENWTVSGPANYRLDRGETAKFTLSFSPAAERAYRGDVRYSSHPDRVTTLRGVGLYPLAAQPPVVQLRSAKNSAARVGIVELQNRTDVPQTVQLAADPRLSMPKEIEVPAKGSASLTLTATTDDASAFDAKVEFAAAEFASSFEVNVSAIGPVLRSDMQELKFPKGVTTAEATLQNTGGVRAFVQTSVQEPFSVPDEERAFPLEPGEKRLMHVRLADPGPSGARTLLTFLAGDTRFQIPMQAEGIVASSTMRAAPRERTQMVTPVFIDRVAPAATPEVFSSIPPVRKWGLGVVTTKSATLIWRTPAGGPARYVIEQRRLAIDANGQLRIEWTPMPDVKIRFKGEEAAAELEKLRPSRLYTLRIVSVDAQGLHSPPSDLIEFFTKAPQPMKLGWLFTLIVAGLLGAVAWRRFATKPLT